VAPVPVRAATADVLAGPDSGISTILLEGRHTVGRDPSNRVELSDPEVGRQHLDVDGPHELGPDDVVMIGATRLAFRPFVRPVDDRIDRLGQIEFHRTPYRPPVAAETTIDPLDSIPTAPDLAELARRAELRTVHFPTPLATSPT